MKHIMTEKKILISKAPPAIRAIATFIENAGQRGYTVKSVKTSPNRDTFLSANNGQETINGTVIGHTGKLTIQS